MSNRLCIFAHFDKDGVIDDYIVHYIKNLKTVASEIIFVSVSNISLEEQEKISSYINNFINKKNEGYDFGSWQAGFEYIGYGNLNQYDEIILANDSCYGPLELFVDIFSKMDAKKNLDAWSITTCHSMNFHMQSYFMVLRKSIFSKSWFHLFWQNISHHINKIDYIEKYEVGLSHLITKNGYKFDSYYKLKGINYIIGNLQFIIFLTYLTLFNKKHAKFKNSFGTIRKKTFIDLILKSFNISLGLYGFAKTIQPLVKVMIFRDNPHKCNIKKLEKIIKNNKNYDFSLIKNHCKRMTI